MTEWTLVTGASRGIGYGLAEQYLKHGHHVIAAARHPGGARELWEMERDYPLRCRLLELDVTNDASIAEAVKSLGDITIGTLIHNAGVAPEISGGLKEATADGAMKAFTVNVIGPMNLTKALLPRLAAAKHPKLVAVSSKMGSIADNTSGGAYAYRMSKAALNMLVKSLAIDHPQIISAVVHPGWVKTAMGGDKAPTTVFESTTGLYHVITRLTEAHSGRFFDFQGKELPW